MFFSPVLRSRSAPVLRDFDRNFERFLNEAFVAPQSARRLNVAQDEKGWTLTLDLPGIAREELAIDVEGSVVRLETQEQAKRPFKAAYELPEEIDAEASVAKLENGVLTLTLTKKKPLITARKIEVK